MTTHVHKKANVGRIQSSIRSIQNEEGIISNWKSGSHMDYTKLNGVAITYWPRKGALMPQGPEEAANAIDARYIQLRNNEGQQEGLRQYQEQQTNHHDRNHTRMSDAANITIPKCQIDELLPYIRRFGESPKCIEDTRTCMGPKDTKHRTIQQVQEASYEMRENQATRNF